MRLPCARLAVALCLVVPASVAGCASGPRVPPEAKLVWHGEGGFAFPRDDFPPGTFYLVDGQSGRTVSAMYRPEGQPLRFDGLKDGRRYSVYYVEGRLASTTRPAGG